MQHCGVEIDDFKHGAWIISHSCTHMQSLRYDRTNYGTIGQSKKVENTLYNTLVQDPDME